jgi:pimeloyl-ACP methyl ester carboxylesterase
MPDPSRTAHALSVPGARLYYERGGTGPLLLLIGSPMDSSGFTPLAGVLSDRYTVITYDPRGTGSSTSEDTDQDVTPELQADDVYRLLTELGGEPADVFGSSGGAVVGLALVTAHPGQVRTLVAHEPPVIELLCRTASSGGQRSGTSTTPMAPTGRTRRCRNSWPTLAWATRPPWMNPGRAGNRRPRRSPGCAPVPAISSPT